MIGGQLTSSEPATTATNPHSTASHYIPPTSTLPILTRPGRRAASRGPLNSANSSNDSCIVSFLTVAPTLLHLLFLDSF